jgi:hypothetical protein
MTELDILLALWIPVAGIAMALLIYEEDDVR